MKSVQENLLSVQCGWRGMEAVAEVIFRARVCVPEQGYWTLTLSLTSHHPASKSASHGTDKQLTWKSYETFLYKLNKTACSARWVENEQALIHGCRWGKNNSSPARKFKASK